MYLCTLPIKQRIEALRKNKGLTLSGVGQKVGVTTDLVGKWERGERNPSTANAIKLAELFKVNIAVMSISPIQPKNMFDNVNDIFSSIIKSGTLSFFSISFNDLSMVGKEVQPLNIYPYDNVAVQLFDFDNGESIDLDKLNHQLVLVQDPKQQSKEKFVRLMQFDFESHEYKLFAYNKDFAPLKAKDYEILGMVIFIAHCTQSQENLDQLASKLITAKNVFDLISTQK